MNDYKIESNNQVTSFNAKTVNIGNIEDSHFLIFYNIEEYFLLQKPHKFDEYDFQSNRNTYYIEYCDQSKFKYGGIDNIVLYRNKVVINLKSETAQALKLSPTIYINFQVNDNDYKKMNEELKNIFSSEICFSISQ